MVKLYRLPAKWYLRSKLHAEWNSQSTDDVKINERPAEYSFAMKWLMQTCPSDVLDVGPGISSWPHVMSNCGFRVTAIDEIAGYWQENYFNRHFYILHDDVTRPKLDRKFDFITCISVIEHISNHQAAIDGLFKLLKKGGHLLLSFPYNEKRYIEDVYRVPGVSYGQSTPYICHVFSRNEIDMWLEQSGAELVDQEYYKIFTGDLWAFGDRVKQITSVSKEDKHHLTCLLLRKR